MATHRSTDLKAEPLDPNCRWIVVHRNGGHGKGQRILVRENPDGSATVIGDGTGRDTTYRKMSKMNA